MGVAQDGQHNGKDAKNFPESAGRLSVMVHGAVSMIGTNATFITLRLVTTLRLYFDSGLRISTENYGFQSFDFKPRCQNAH